MSNIVRMSFTLVSLSVLTVSAAAAERAVPQRGEVPTALLADLGLGDLHPLTDQQGHQIRGGTIVTGSPALGEFVTMDRGAPKVLNAGTVIHVLGDNHSTTILAHPQFGDFTVPATRN